MTSLPYVLIFCLFLIGGFLEYKLARQNQIRFIRTIVVIIALIFFGLRGHILTDFLNYYPFFINLDASNIETYAIKYSPGFVYSTFFLKTFIDSYHFWVFITTSIHIIILSTLFNRYLGNISLGLLFYIAFRGIHIEFNLMQNFTAILLFMLSITYIHQRRIIPYFAMNLIGLTFHITSLLYFPLYFFLNKNLSMRISFMIVFLATIFYFVGIEFFVEQVLWLISISGLPSLYSFFGYFVDTSSFKLSFGFLERLLVLIMIIIFGKKIKSEIKHGNIFYNIAIIYYLFFMLFSPIDTLADRIPILFIIFYWVIPPALIIIKHRYRTILACMLIPLSLMKLITSTQDQVAQYDNLLIGIKSYEQRANEVLEHNERNRK